MPTNMRTSSTIQSSWTMMIGLSRCFMPYRSQITATTVYAAHDIAETSFLPITQMSYTWGSVMSGPKMTAKYIHLSIGEFAIFFLLRFW